MKRAFVLGLSLTLLAAATPAATQQARSISAADKATGAKAHPELLTQFGGAYKGPAADYVARVGKRIAVQSGLSNSQSDFTVTLLNSSVDNAFALPGGYVYVTRQLLAQMNDEAELASVLGHEVGHVAARHSTKRSNTSTFGQILATGVGVLTGSSAIGQIAGYGAQLYTLRFSRAQEYQADDLGIRYLAGASYDPFAASDMLAQLNAEATLEARIKGSNEAVPGWASTHPNTLDRVRRARAKAAETGAVAGQGERNRDAFLAAIDGLLYDDDPAQGTVEGRTFRHPTLGLRFTAPEGFQIANGSDAVVVSGSAGKAEFQAARASGSLADEVAAGFRSVASNAALDASSIRPIRVGGAEGAMATLRANSNSQTLDVSVVAFRLQAGTTSRFVTITRAGTGLGPFTTMIDSVTRMGAADAAAVRPRRVSVVTVRPGDTVASLSARMAYADFRSERFLALNGLEAGQALRPGDRVKLIVR
jgi:predicted Zn-dependent protease